MIVVDSSVWIDWLRNEDTAETAWLTVHLAKEPLALTDLILFEVLRGVRDGRVLAETERALLPFEVFGTGGEELARQSARHYRLLRSAGLTVRSLTDCLVASFCIREGHTLLHCDRDFDGFEQHLGLTVVRP